MNIFVTAIGSYAGRPVINAIRNKVGGFIAGCDIHNASWLDISSHVNAFYQVKPCMTKGYLDQVVNIITTNKINLTIPLIDPEVDLYSENREHLENSDHKLAISNHKSILISRNKLKLFKLFRDHTDVNVIPTFTGQNIGENNLTEKYIGKPRTGRSSRGIIQLDRRTLPVLADKLDDYIFQPYINGQIFTIDCIRDKFGNVVSVARKELIRTSHGAGITVEIMNHNYLQNLVEIILSELNYFGFANIEFIFDGQKYFLMDINPRFSAGVGFSILSGSNIIENTIKCFNGDAIRETNKLHYGIYSKVMHEKKISR